MRLDTPRTADRREFLDLVAVSAPFHRPWTFPPADAPSYRRLLERSRREDFDLQLLRRNDDDAIVGLFELAGITRGFFQSAYVGYWVGAPYAGQGYMLEGMRLLFRLAFGDLKLHRLEANIQPENRASKTLAKRAGFRREGYSPRYLKIGGRWRDHERWAILAEEAKTLK
ncbi:MAG: GNAT family N-acetyltransferase [Thermoleophilaceae bacterium]